MIASMGSWPITPEFQLLAPLIVTRDPMLVRHMLVRRQRGELTFAEALAALEGLPMSEEVHLINVHAEAKAKYEAALGGWFRARGDDLKVARALAAKNTAWCGLENVRTAIQRHLRG
jgi:hypothetical protein